MLKNKKLLAVVPILLFVGYTMTKPKPKVPKQKVAGTLYVMPQTFLLNLSDGRYAKITVALQLAPGQSDGASATASGSSGSESAGTLPEEPLVREIVTNTVTNQTGEALVDPKSRSALRHQILLSITRTTDLKVEAVLFPDLTVQ
ncbi:MAG TPA: flagellar basal body-associated FliL family protein [Solirubrobacteraceae bacterium]|nr:flagellar basal body-associated FliL family protein [Solirubrobacteraceae bacterium]